MPGPACYGSGGAEPTITDANLHLGRLPAVARLAGGIALDTVVVPMNPGVLSAYGILQTDTRHDTVQSFYLRVADLTEGALEAALADLEKRARLIMKEDGFDDQAITLEPSADLGYSGHEYEGDVASRHQPGDEAPDRRDTEPVAEPHNVRSGHSNPGEAVEFVNLRMAAFGRLPAPVTAERTWSGGAWFETPVYHRSSMPTRHRLRRCLHDAGAAFPDHQGFAGMVTWFSAVSETAVLTMLSTMAPRPIPVEGPIEHPTTSKRVLEVPQPCES